ncbi:MAG: division plane positioning ATPase MipZ [Sphingomonadaceae bacterium]
MQTSSKLSTKFTTSAAPIVISGGDKGGTGKSFLARTALSYLRWLGRMVVGFDCDNRNAHLERYAGTRTKVFRHNIRDHSSCSEMLTAWEGVDPNCIILVDLPGNIGDVLEVQKARIKLLASALNRPLICLWAATEEEDSIWLLKPMLDFIPPSQTLFIMNGRFGETLDKFELWNRSNTRAEFLAAGGSEGHLPVLSIYPRTKIARARCAFDDLAGAGLSMTEQIDFELWWAGVNRALQPLSDLLEIAR